MYVLICCTMFTACFMGNSGCAGIQLEHLHLAASVLDKLEVMFVKVEACTVDFLEVYFPSWTQPLRIKIRGLKFDVRQNNMPQVRQP